MSSSCHLALGLGRSPLFITVQTKRRSTCRALLISCASKGALFTSPHKQYAQWICDRSDTLRSGFLYISCIYIRTIFASTSLSWQASPKYVYRKYGKRCVPYTFTQGHKVLLWRDYPTLAVSTHFGSFSGVALYTSFAIDLSMTHKIKMLLDLRDSDSTESPLWISVTTDDFMMYYSLVP